MGIVVETSSSDRHRENASGLHPLPRIKGVRNMMRKDCSYSFFIWWNGVRPPAYVVLWPILKISTFATRACAWDCLGLCERLTQMSPVHDHARYDAHTGKQSKKHRHGIPRVTFISRGKRAREREREERQSEARNIRVCPALVAS